MIKIFFIALAWLIINISNASEFTIKLPNSYLKTSIQSLKDLKYKGIVKQNRDYSCGVASLATILNLQYGKNYDEDFFLKQLDDGSKEIQGYSLLDIKKLAVKEGFKPKAYFLNEEAISNLAVPAIIHIRTSRQSLSIEEEYREGHFTVLTHITKNKYHMLDPSLGRITMNKGRFMRKWKKSNEKGIVMVFYKDSDIAIPSFDNTQKNNIPKIHYLEKNLINSKLFYYFQ